MNLFKKLWKKFYDWEFDIDYEKTFTISLGQILLIVFVLGVLLWLIFK